MKQNSNDNRCVAIVVAMATGTDPKQFEDWCNHEPPYSELEMAQFLALNNCSAVLGLGEDYFYNKIDVTDSETPIEKRPEIMYSRKEDFGPESIIDLSFQVKDVPAILVVKAKDPTKTHVVYWNGQYIMDPNPMTPEGRDFASYHILKYFPIFKMKG